MADEPVPSIVIGGIEHAATIAAALRRSSSLNTGNHPTRTLRITASEKNSSRDNTPISISAEELTRRPRSNPRSRTPMRYESPLQTDAFRASSPSPVQEDSRRFSIRPLTGMAVGTVSRIVEDRRSARPVAVTKSTKQGPSHRKIRRWNNEHFDGLAAEISSRGGAVAAQVLLYAQREAHLYRSIYDPKDHGQAENIKRYVVSSIVGSIRLSMQRRLSSLTQKVHTSFGQQ